MNDDVSCAGGNGLRDQRPLKKADQKYGSQMRRIIDDAFKNASVISGVFVRILPGLSVSVNRCFYAVYEPMMTISGQYISYH